MKKTSNLWLAVTLIAACLSFNITSSIDASANAYETKALHKGVRTLVKAINTKNDALYYKMMWPEILELAGGKEKLLKQVKAIRKRDKELGKTQKYSQLKFHKSPKYYRAGKRKFAVIPFQATIKLTAPNKTMRAELFYLGIKDSRKSRWVYLDGFFFSIISVKEFVQDFPADATLPQTRIISQSE
ncbi:MAG: hypothetical protein ACRBBN_17380 [Methyloligellaceae bacterium]